MTEHYYQHDRNHRLHKRVKTFKWFLKGAAIGSLVLIPIAVLYINFFVVKEPEPVVSSVQTSTFKPTTNIFRTPFFQFQADETWDADADATKDGVRYVYRAFRGPLIEQDLVIEINPTSKTLDSTRIQSVAAETDGTLRLSYPLSDHCDTDLPDKDKDREQELVINKVTFMCDADDTIFDALVGLEDGTPYMLLTRPDDSQAMYTIYYRDLRALPTGSALRGIIQSFQTR